MNRERGKKAGEKFREALGFVPGFIEGFFHKPTRYALRVVEVRRGVYDGSNFIHTIKGVRTVAGLPLKEAKDVVEQHLPFGHFLTLADAMRAKDRFADEFQNGSVEIVKHETR